MINFSQMKQKNKAGNVLCAKYFEEFQDKEREEMKIHNLHR